MPRRFVRQVEPIVHHGLRELRLGIPVDHTLREVALMGALVGAGMSPVQAIHSVERHEAALIGMPRGEQFEMMCHPQLAYGGKPWTMGAPDMGYGKPPACPTGMGKPPACPTGMGKPPVSPMGLGKPPVSPMGFGKPPVSPMGFGKPPISPMGFGKPPVSPMGFGKPPVSPMGFGKPPACPTGFGKPPISPMGFGKDPVTPWDDPGWMSLSADMMG
jgi:hypothetical protein